MTRSSPRTPTTTIRSTSALLLFASLVAQAAEPVPEVQVVEAALARPWATSRLAAGATTTLAEGTPPPLWSDPELQLRREQANGPAGADTRAVGGGVDVDLGMASLSHRTAARRREDAARSTQRADATSIVCDLRRGALQVVEAREQLRVHQDLLDRLDAVQHHLERESTAGLASGFASRRLQLVAQTQRVGVEEVRARLDQVRAWLEARSGVDVERVELSPLAPLEPLDSWLHRGLSRDPRLAALRSAVDAARAELTAARRGRVPDLTLQGGARWDAMPDGTSREGGWEVGGALQLPVFGAGREDRRRAEAALREAEAALAEREVVLSTHLRASWSRSKTLASGVELPDTEPLWSGAVERYLAGEASLSELLDVGADVEAADLVRVGRRVSERRARLDLECTAGTFEMDVYNDIIDEVTR